MVNGKNIARIFVVMGFNPYSTGKNNKNYLTHFFLNMHIIELKGEFSY